MLTSSVSSNDRAALRELSSRYLEIASSEIMGVRKRQWKALHDLKPERPMIIFEPFWLQGFMDDYTLRCQDPVLRNVELRMAIAIRQYEIMGDDVVLEPYFRIAWWGKDLVVTPKKLGDIEIIEHGAKEASLAYLSNFPLATPDDVRRLEHRQLSIDRTPSLTAKAKLEDIFGDILPVRLANFDNFDFDLGNQPFVGNNFIGITWDLFKLIGQTNMMLWPYDYPDTIHEICRFLADEKKAFYQFLLDENLLDFNTDNQFGGPSSYGYVSDLPACGMPGPVELKSLWCWPESQESQPISPKMYDEFYLPYIAELANQFGLSYYGCCETVHDRFEVVRQSIKNIRTVSVAGWTDFDKIAEQLGNRYVFSRKPVPALVSGVEAEWDLVEKDALRTKKAALANNCCVEIICRDVYSSLCTPQRAVQWVDTWKRIMDIK